MEAAGLFHPNQPFYTLLCDGSGEVCFSAYVAEEDLEADHTCVALRHPGIGDWFTTFRGATYEGERRFHA